ncbi:MAG: hypothetical protein SFV53_04505 [Rickettsiales bacterium]|nr:hypothetical protein [Rickettsiales bacterium]
MKNTLAIFEKFKIRRQFDEKSQKWFFSVIDIVAALIEQSDFNLARNYWKALKHRLVKEGSEVVTNCNQLKMIAEDGKMRITDVADLETVFRLIQSVPSPKSEPIKTNIRHCEERSDVAILRSLPSVSHRLPRHLDAPRNDGKKV